MAAFTRDQWGSVPLRSDHIGTQVIPSHKNPQMRRTLFDGYLFKYCSVKYQTFHQVSEKTSQQTYSHQKTTWKAFQMPPRAIKHQLTCPMELASGSFLIGRRGILVISRVCLICVVFTREQYHLGTVQFQIWSLSQVNPFDTGYKNRSRADLPGLM